MFRSRTVWIFARPLSYSRWLPSLGKISDGRFELCHWAVLVSERSIEEVKASTLHTSTTDDGSFDNQVLGDLYELDRIGSRNTLHRSRSFDVAKLLLHWPRFSAEFVGDTCMTATEIGHVGTQWTLMFCWYIAANIIQKHPDYHLFASGRYPNCLTRFFTSSFRLSSPCRQHFRRNKTASSSCISSTDWPVVASFPSPARSRLLSC